MFFCVFFSFLRLKPAKSQVCLLPCPLSPTSVPLRTCCCHTHTNVHECRTEKMCKCQLAPDCYLANASAAASFVGISESVSGEAFEEEKDSHNRTTPHTPHGHSTDKEASDHPHRVCSVCLVFFFFSLRASPLLCRKAKDGVRATKSWYRLYY